MLLEVNVRTVIPSAHKYDISSHETPDNISECHEGLDFAMEALGWR